MEDEQVPLNIWSDITKTFGIEMNLVFQGKSVVGIHGSGLTDIVNDLEFIITGLRRYREKMIEYYEYGSIDNYKENDSTTYVYLFKDESTGFYKIGSSRNPKYREKTLMCERPTITSIFVSRITLVQKERELHKLFKKKRVRGEWFNLDETDIEVIKNYNYGE